MANIILSESFTRGNDTYVVTLDAAHTINVFLTDVRGNTENIDREYADEVDAVRDFHRVVYFYR